MISFLLHAALNITKQSANESLKDICILPFLVLFRCVSDSVDCESLRIKIEKLYSVIVDVTLYPPVFQKKT